MQRQSQLLKSCGEILAAESVNALRAKQARPEDLEGNGFDFVSGPASGAERSDQAAGAGTGDEVRGEAVTFQRPHDSDMCQPAKATSAEGQTEGINASAVCRVVHNIRSRVHHDTVNAPWMQT